MTFILSIVLAYLLWWPAAKRVQYSFITQWDNSQMSDNIVKYSDILYFVWTISLNCLPVPPDVPTNGTEFCGE